MSNAAIKDTTPINPLAPEPTARAKSLPDPFAREMVPRPVQVTPINSQLHVRRTGIIALAIGSSRIVKGRDGTKRQFQARQLSHELALAEREGRELTMSCVCFECRKAYTDLDALIADHPTTLEMRELNEAHTYAYWSEDNFDAAGLENAAALMTEKEALQRAHRDCLDNISKLSDVEKIMAQRKRAEEIKGHVEETEKKRLGVAENIMGLLSDVPPTV